MAETLTAIAAVLTALAPVLALVLRHLSDEHRRYIYDVAKAAADAADPDRIATRADFLEELGRIVEQQAGRRLKASELPILEAAAAKAHAAKAEAARAAGLPAPPSPLR